MAIRPPAGRAHTRIRSGSKWTWGPSITSIKVVLNWETAYGVAYKIQISSDGSNWETLYSTTTGIGGIEDLSVSGSGRYMRMYGTSQAEINGASYGYSLYEFEVYGAQ